MGLEAFCTVRSAGRSGEGRARLESDAVRFTGAFRLVIALRDLTRVAVRGGALHLTCGGETSVFQLGKDAPRWAHKIQNPPSVLDKLGIKADHAVSVMGTVDRDLLAQIRSRAEKVHVGRASAGSAVIFFGATRATDLARLTALRKVMAKDAAIWVLWTKGQPALKEDHIRAAALSAGLVDVKVASVSPVSSGLKLMIPRAKR